VTIILHFVLESIEFSPFSTDIWLENLIHGLSRLNENSNIC